MVPIPNFATLPGALVPAGFDLAPVFAVDAASSASFLAALVGVVVALVVARVRRARRRVQTASEPTRKVPAAA
jgi:hypothetical protein